jgi:hypothetical protein
MDVQIGELNARVTVADDASLLHPTVVAKLVEHVMARLKEVERARGITDDNTRFSRSAADRPDMLR